MLTSKQIWESTSIKKAQMFGELAEHLNVQIEIKEGMSLDDYPTLNHIIDFLMNASAPTAKTETTTAPVAASNGQHVAVTPQPVVEPAPTATQSRPELEKFLVNFVVEQTGYPEEMVELDVDLEADLGIDSIKKAQMFGELAEHLNVQIEIKEGMSLDDYPTLNHIIDFLMNASAPTAKTETTTAPVAASNGQHVVATPQPVVEAAPTATQSRPELEKFLVNFVVEQTGYPEEMVELDVDLEADLGIDSIKKAQMFGELAEHLNVQIEIKEGMSLDDYPTLNHIIDFLMNASAPTAKAETTTAPVAASNGQHVVATPQPVVEAAPATSSTQSRPELEKFLVNFVVEQTGYPEEMVELDVDLEADLGIDSIKKAQMFGELAEHLNVQIEIKEGMSLDDYPIIKSYY